MNLLNIMVLLSVKNQAGPARPSTLGRPSQTQAGPAQDPWFPKPNPSRSGPGPLAPQAKPKPVRPRIRNDTMLLFHKGKTGQYNRQFNRQYYKNKCSNFVKICITNVLNMGPMGPRGLGPWAQGPQGPWAHKHFRF